MAEFNLSDSVASLGSLASLVCCYATTLAHASTSVVGLMCVCCGALHTHPYSPPLPATTPPIGGPAWQWGTALTHIAHQHQPVGQGTSTPRRRAWAWHGPPCAFWAHVLGPLQHGPGCGMGHGQHGTSPQGGACQPPARYLRGVGGAGAASVALGASVAVTGL